MISPNDFALLCDLLDGRLDPAAAEAVRLRITADPETAAAWDDLRRLRAGMRALPAPAVPSDFLVRVKARAEAGTQALPRPAVPAPWLAGPVWLAAAACVGVALGLGVFLWTSSARREAAVREAASASPPPPSAGAVPATRSQPLGPARTPEKAPAGGLVARPDTSASGPVPPAPETGGMFRMGGAVPPGLRAPSEGEPVAPVDAAGATPAVPGPTPAPAALPPPTVRPPAPEASPPEAAIPLGGGGAGGDTRNRDRKTLPEVKRLGAEKDASGKGTSGTTVDSESGAEPAVFLLVLRAHSVEGARADVDRALAALRQEAVDRAERSKAEAGEPAPAAPTAPASPADAGANAKKPAAPAAPAGADADAKKPAAPPSDEAKEREKDRDKAAGAAVPLGSFVVDVPEDLWPRLADVLPSRVQGAAEAEALRLSRFAAREESGAPKAEEGEKGAAAPTTPPPPPPLPPPTAGSPPPAAAKEAPPAGRAPEPGAPAAPPDEGRARGGLGKECKDDGPGMEAAPGAGGISGEGRTLARVRRVRVLVLPSAP